MGENGSGYHMKGILLVVCSAENTETSRPLPPCPPVRTNSISTTRSLPEVEQHSPDVPVIRRTTDKASNFNKSKSSSSGGSGNVPASGRRTSFLGRLQHIFIGGSNSDGSSAAITEDSAALLPGDFKQLSHSATMEPQQQDFTVDLVRAPLRRSHGARRSTGNRPQSLLSLPYWLVVLDTVSCDVAVEMRSDFHFSMTERKSLLQHQKH